MIGVVGMVHAGRPYHYQRRFRRWSLHGSEQSRRYEMAFFYQPFGFAGNGPMYWQNTEPHAGQALRALRTGVVRHRFETFVDPIIDVAYIKTLSSSQR
jgi:hypothetical protein